MHPAVTDITVVTVGLTKKIVADFVLGVIDAADHDGATPEGWF